MGRVLIEKQRDVVRLEIETNGFIRGNGSLRVDHLVSITRLIWLDGLGRKVWRDLGRKSLLPWPGWWRKEGREGGWVIMSGRNNILIPGWAGKGWTMLVICLYGKCVQVELIC